MTKLLLSWIFFFFLPEKGCVLAAPVENGRKRLMKPWRNRQERDDKRCSAIFFLWSCFDKQFPGDREHREKYPSDFLRLSDISLTDSAFYLSVRSPRCTVTYVFTRALCSVFAVTLHSTRRVNQYPRRFPFIFSCSNAQPVWEYNWLYSLLLLHLWRFQFSHSAKS